MIRWIEPVVSDEACRLLKVAWQLVGLMTKTGHRSFRSMNQPRNANTGWTWTGLHKRQLVGWASARPFQAGQVVDDPLQYANHLISY